MQAKKKRNGLFECIPDYGLTLSASGTVVCCTSPLRSIVGNSPAEGAKIGDILPDLKRRSITRLNNTEFTHHASSRFFRFRITVKPVEPPGDERYVVWFKDITAEFRQGQISRLLLNIAQLELDAKSPTHFYETIRDELNSLFDAENLHVALFDRFRINLNLVYLSATHNPQEPYPKGNTLAHLVAETGKAMLLGQRQVRQLQKRHRLEVYGSDALCFMGAPLAVKDEVIGVIVVQSYLNANVYSHDDLNVLSLIASQIAACTQRKEKEAELLLAKEKAVEADKLKSAFLANMSHEIRTPMNAILGFSELISRKNIQPEKREIYTQHIVNNGKLLLGLVDDIIDLAKIEAGQLRVRRSPTNIDELLSELQHVYIAEKKRLGKDDIQIVRESSRDGSRQWLLCDSLRLKQVMLNLLSNALKFTFAGSIAFGYEPLNNATILFYVKDSGIGIAPDQQQVIFDRFRQADSSATRQFGGTGLGLAISKKLVELMGGRIWVESTPRVGSKFMFTLPLIIPDLGSKQPMERATPTLPQSYRGRTALVVEDNEANFVYLHELLSPTGLKIVRACSGQEAVTLIERGTSIDIVLMDIQLPKMDGLEAARRIKKLRPAIPIVAQTAYALADERAKTLDAGCDHYLAKPIASNTLLQLLDTTLLRAEG